MHRLIHLLLTFLLVLFSTMTHATRNQYFDADNYDFGGTGTITKTELYYLQGLSGNAQTVIDAKVSDTAYDATSWNGVTSIAPSKNAVRDQIESMVAISSGLVSDTAYNTGTWDAVTTVAPSKNAVRDQIETMLTSISATVSDTAYNAGTWDAVTTIAPSKNAVRDQMELKANLASPALTGTPTAPTATALSGSFQVATTQYADNADAVIEATTLHKTGNESASGTKTFTGKMVTSSTTNGSVPCPIMTAAQMASIASPADGDCVYNSTTKALNYYNGTTTAWTAIGSGGGGGSRLELMTDSSFESGVAEGACTTCSASQESTIVMATPNNTKALKMAFTASTGYYIVDKSTSAYFTNIDGTVGAWIRTDQSGCYFKSRQNGADTGDQKTILSDSIYHYYQLNLSAGATSIGYKIDCTASITGNVYVDETTIKADPRLAVLANVANVSSWQSYTPTFTGFGTATNIEFQWRQLGEDIQIRGKFTSGVSTTTEARISLPNNYTSSGSPKIPSIQVAGYSGKNASTTTVIPLIEPSVTYLTFGQQVGTGSGAFTKTNGDSLVVNGSQLGFTALVPVNGLTATNPNLLIAPDTFSTDTNGLTFKTSAVTSSDAVGTYSTYSYAINSNTKTVCATAPTTLPTASDGILIYTRAYNAASTCGNPARYEIQIGKNLKGVTRNLYKSANKVMSGNLESVPYTVTTDSGLIVNSYNESTGILYLDGGSTWSGSVTAHNFFFNDGTAQTSGYLTINASKNPALTGLNIPKSEVYVTGGSGHGSTNTKIRRFTTTITQTGSDITNSGDSATLGHSFTINTAGVYAITYCDTYSASGAWFGASVNSSQLTTAIFSITEANRIGSVATTVSAIPPCYSATTNLNAGDVVRAHTEGTVSGTLNYSTNFRITKVSF